MITYCLKRFVWGITVIACLALPFIQVSSVLGQVIDPYSTHKKLNPTRFTNSCQVIQSYLNELYTNLDFALQPGNEAAAEYLSQKVIAPGFNSGGSIRDPLVQEEINTVYQTFTNKVGTIGEQFNTRVSTLSPGRNTALQLDGSPCFITELLYYEKMYKSPFIYEGADVYENKPYPDSRAFYDAIVWRNASKVNALKDYIKEVEKIYKKIVSRTNLSRIDDATLDTLDDLAILLYKATTKVRYFQLDWAMQKYARDTAIYDAYTNFFDRCWSQYYGFHTVQQGFDDSYYSTEPLLFPGNHPYFTRYEDVRTLTRTLWNSCKFRIDVTTFRWTPGTGWHREGYELHMDGFLDDFAVINGVPYTCWNGHVFTPKGRYDIGAITSSAAHDIEITYANKYGVDPGGNIADIKAGLIPAVCSYFDSYNSYYDASKAAMEQLRDSLNSIIDSYKGYLPYTRPFSLVNEHLAYMEDLSDCFAPPFTTYYWCPTLDFDLTYDPAFSVAASNDGPKTLPASFTLSNTLTDFPPDGGPAQYRWIITHIPQSSQARSPRYVTGQVISTGSTAVLDLRGTGTADDLASNPPYGNWEVTLEVNNNRPQLYTTQTAIQANRIILGVIHDDKQIQLTTAIDPDTTTQYSGYYLELSNENANVYWNYDDDNCPVDDMGGFYTPPDQSRIFSLKRDPSYKPLFGTGALYDGVYGSTDLLSNEKSIFSLGTEAAKLYSASFSDSSDSDLRGHHVPIIVKVYDPQVTELFLGYGDDWATRVKIHRQAAPLSGSYYIKQWIDYYTWSNPVAWLPNSRTAFTRKKKGNSVPDWMERCAEEAIEMGFPESVKYISGFGVGTAEMGNTNPPFSKTIYINPFYEMMRVNGPDADGYGFGTAHLNDGTARHEAFHQFYFWQYYPLHPNQTTDLDFDFLPNKIKGEDIFLNDRYFYMFDSGTKFVCGGPTGPSSLNMPTTFSQIPSYSYGGDSTEDSRLALGTGSVYALKYGKTLRKAVLKYDWNFHQSSPIVHPPFPDRVIIVGGETHYMYRNPIYLLLQAKFPDLQVGTYYAEPFLLARKAEVFGSDDCEVKKIALTPTVATSELLDLLTYPKLQVIFPTTSVYWTQLFDYWETSRGYRIDDCIYYNFAFRPPSPDQEYDACMGEPGVYIGVGGRPPGP